MAASRATGVNRGFAIAVALAAGLGLLLALAAPASAEAAMKYEGGTGQGKPIKLRANARGIVNRVRVGGRVRCRNGRPFSGHSLFRAPLRRANPKGFRDVERGAFTESGIRLAFTDWITGRYVRDNRRRIKGTYRVRLTLRYRGRTIDRCRLRTRWRAGLVS